MDDKFKVVNENGVESDAEIVTVFTYKERDYIVYTIDKNEEDTDVFVSRLVKDSEGYDEIQDIEDENERLEVQNIVNELLDSIKEDTN